MFRTHRSEIIVGLLLLLIIFVPHTADLGRFMGHDELMRNRQSLDSFQALIDGRWGDVYSSNFGGTNLTWAQTGYRLYHFLRLRLVGENVTLADMANYGPAFNPLPGAIFNALLLVILYPFLRKLFGWPTAALATAILALDPYLLSEARILRTEAAYATFITLTSVTLAIYARSLKRRYLVWTGVWLAWAVATKVSGVILVPAIGLVLLTTIFSASCPITTTGQRLKRFAFDLVLVGVTTLVGAALIWPTWWENPEQTITELVAFVNLWGFSPKGFDSFYMGTILEELPASYYLLILLYKTTPLTWLGLLAFAWSALQSRPAEAGAAGPRWIGFTFPAGAGLIILVCAVTYILFMSISLFKTERYMMAAVSNLNVVAAVGLVGAGQMINARWVPIRLPRPVVWLAALLLLVITHGALTWLNHPYYFSYYNPLLGGGYSAVKNVEVGSGEVLDRAIDYLNQQPVPQNQVVVCGTNLPRCEYAGVGQTFINRDALNKIHSTWVSADYVVTYVLQEQRGDYPPGVIEYLEQHQGPAYIAGFQGIEYARVYPAPKVQYTAASELTGISTLLGYNLSQTRLRAGDPLEITYYLENDGRIEDEMFVQLVDTDSYIWSEATGKLLPEFEQLTGQRGAIVVGQATLVLPTGTPPGRYFVKMGYRNGDGELIGMFTLPQDGDTIDVTLPDQFATDLEPARTLNLKIDPTLTLTGYELDPERLDGEQSVWLTLFWWAISDVQRDYVVNLRLLNAAHEEVAYWLGRPVRSGYPTNQWQAGQVVQDPWLLVLPDDLPASEYWLEIVLFDAETGAEISRTLLAPVNLQAGLN